LALVVAIGLLGPLLATPAGWRLPVLLGELIAGIAFGDTGTRTLHPGDPTFTLLADVGFALVMFVAGSHVPVRDARLRSSLRIGLVRAVAVGLLAVPAGLLLSHVFGTGHAAVYAVLMASSSAALVAPIVDSLGLSGPHLLDLLPQVAAADTACIVALPLVIEPSHAGRAALGALGVIASAAVLYVLLRWAERSGKRKELHRFSEKRRFALELRISLLALFGLAAIATRAHISIMLAGFALGIAVASVGEPRRLARQLFALSDGFLGPLFFVWLGASLDLRAVGHRPSLIVLGVALGVGAVAVHAVTYLLGQPLPLAALAAAQLGVPVAAATLGTQLHLLRAGESGALILGALVTILVAAAAGSLSARRYRGTPTPGSQAETAAS